jgi:hypothetical protein
MRLAVTLREYAIRIQVREQEAAALAINNRAAAWAYRLDNLEAARLAPPLADLIPGQ